MSDAVLWTAILAQWAYLTIALVILIRVKGNLGLPRRPSFRGSQVVDVVGWRALLHLTLLVAAWPFTERRRTAWVLEHQAA